MTVLIAQLDFRSFKRKWNDETYQECQAFMFSLNPVCREWVASLFFLVLLEDCVSLVVDIDEMFGLSCKRNMLGLFSHLCRAGAK